MRGALLALTLVTVTAWVQAERQGPPPSPTRAFEEAVTLVDSRDDCQQAIPVFERIAGEPDRALAARALVYLGDCYERLGNEKARQAYRRVVDQFSDQRVAAARARARLSALDRALEKLPRLMLRKLWSEPLRYPDVAGKPAISGLAIPMLDAQGRMVVTDIDMRHPRQPVALGAAGGGLPACAVQTEVVLSPDAKRAAFSCEAASGGYEFRVIRTDAAGPRPRRLVSEFIEPIEWSRGDVVLVQRGTDNSKSLALVDVGSGHVQTVTALEAPVDGASMSPDGAWISFDGPDGSGRHDVFLVSSRGGRPEAIGTGASDDLLPGWSPDGSGVVFISDRTGSPGLWLQRISNGRASGPPQVLEQDLGRVADAWGLTRDGAFFYFRQTGLVSVAVAELDQAGRVTGTPSTAGTGQLGATQWPTWSPDGQRLAYQIILTGSRLVALGIRDVASGDERILRPGLKWFGRPRWSPDGRRIAVRGRDTAGRDGLYLLDPETGRPAPLKLMPRLEESTLRGFQWAPDGTLLALVRKTLWRISPDTGAEEPLLDVPAGTYAFAASPADGTLAFLWNSDPNRFGGVITLRATGATPRELLRIAPGEMVRDLEWMPDGRALVYTRTSADRAVTGRAAWPSVWRVEIDTGTARPIDLAMDRLRDLAVSPDGRHLAFNTGAPSREPWIVENFLPRPAARGAVMR